MPLEMKTSGAIRCILSPRAELEGLVDMLKRERGQVERRVYPLEEQQRPTVAQGLCRVIGDRRDCRPDQPVTLARQPQKRTVPLDPLLRVFGKEP